MKRLLVIMGLALLLLSLGAGVVQAESDSPSEGHEGHQASKLVRYLNAYRVAHGGTALIELDSLDDSSQADAVASLAACDILAPPGFPPATGIWSSWGQFQLHTAKAMWNSLVPNFEIFGALIDPRYNVIGVGHAHTSSAPCTNPVPTGGFGGKDVWIIEVGYSPTLTIVFP